MNALLLLAALVPAAPPAQPGDSLILDLPGRVLAVRGLAGIPRDTVTASFHGGPARRYSGVRVRELLTWAGAALSRLRGQALAQYLIVEAGDGYRVAFGVAELDTSLVAHGLFLADQAEGGALPADEGPWRLVVAGDRGAARSVRNVRAIRLRAPH